jgi:hypothetical protein
MALLPPDQCLFLDYRAWFTDSRVGGGLPVLWIGEFVYQLSCWIAEEFGPTPQQGGETADGGKCLVWTSFDGLLPC